VTTTAHLVAPSGWASAPVTIEYVSDFDPLVIAAMKRRGGACIAWVTDEDGTKGFWGPLGAQPEPHWWGTQGTPVKARVAKLRAQRKAQGLERLDVYARKADHPAILNFVDKLPKIK